jgi:hypothetical protein
LLNSIRVRGAAGELGHHLVELSISFVCKDGQRKDILKQGTANFLVYRRLVCPRGLQVWKLTFCSCLSTLNANWQAPFVQGGRFGLAERAPFHNQQLKIGRDWSRVVSRSRLHLLSLFDRTTRSFQFSAIP